MIGIVPSDAMISIMQQNVDGKISSYDIEEELERSECGDDDDLVTARIYKVLCEDGFSFNQGTLKTLNRILFFDIYEDAGEYRDDSVEGYLDKVFRQDIREELNDITIDDLAKYIAKLSVDIFKIKPFRHGNIRTTMIFVERYLNFLGLKIDYNIFTKFIVHLKAGLECAAELYLTEFFKNVIEFK